MNVLLSLQAIPREFDSNNWITVLLVCIISLIAFIKLNYAIDFYHFRRLLISNKYFSKNKSALTILGRFGGLLFIVRLLLVSLGLYYLLIGLGYSTATTFTFYSKIAIIYTVFTASKCFLEKIVGALFSIELLSDRYIFFKISYKNFLSFFLLPLIIILAYTWDGSPFFYKIATGLFLLFNLGFLAYFYKKRKQLILQNMFYFILYLCIFEFAPYYILYKAIAKF